MSLPRKRKTPEKTAMPIELLVSPSLSPSFPARYVEHAAITVSEERKILVSPTTAPARGADGSTITYVVKDPLARHYFHFLEVVIWIYALQQEYFPSIAVENILFEDPEWNKIDPNIAQSDILASLFEDANTLSAEECGRIDARHCVVIDRALDRSPINKFCEPSLGFSWKWVPRMQAKILAGLTLRRRGAHERTRILYVRNEPPRHLLPDLEERLLLTLARFGEIEPVDLAGRRLREQMELAIEADIMVGVHGIGLNNALWLPPGATVIELFPPGVHHYDHQIICEMLGLPYFGLEGDILYRDGSRFGPPYGHEPEHINRPVEVVNFAALENIIARRAAG